MDEYPSIPKKPRDGILFNNREIAAAFWLLPFVGWLASRADMRAMLVGIVRSLLAWKILAILAAMTLYSAGLIYGFHKVGFWQAGMIKDTAIWFMASFVMVARFVISRKVENIIKEIIVDEVSLTLLVEFLMDRYTLSVPAEFVLFPVVTSLTLMAALAQLDKRNTDVANLTSFLLALFLLSILGYAIFCALDDYRNLGVMDNLKSIAFPPVMSILFSPFVYGAVIVCKYEELFIPLKIGRKRPPAVNRYAMCKMLLYCGLSLRRLDELKSDPRGLRRIETNEDVDQFLKSHAAGKQKVDE